MTEELKSLLTLLALIFLVPLTVAVPIIWLVISPHFEKVNKE